MSKHITHDVSGKQIGEHVTRVMTVDINHLPLEMSIFSEETERKIFNQSTR